MCTHIAKCPKHFIFPQKNCFVTSNKARKGNQQELIQESRFAQNSRKFKVPNKVSNKETIIEKRKNKMQVVKKTISLR